MVVTNGPLGHSKKKRSFKNDVIGIGRDEVIEYGD
jgi:HJR/Mrr/RecB family endonuclease